MLHFMFFFGGAGSYMNNTTLFVINQQPRTGGTTQHDLENPPYDPAALRTQPPSAQDCSSPTLGPGPPWPPLLAPQAPQAPVASRGHWGLPACFDDSTLPRSPGWFDDLICKWWVNVYRTQEFNSWIECNWKKCLSI